MGFNETKDTITEKVREAEAFAADMPARMEEAREMARDWKTRAEAMVREKPVICLAGAFAIGFLLAKVARHA